MSQVFPCGDRALITPQIEVKERAAMGHLALVTWLLALPQSLGRDISRDSNSSNCFARSRLQTPWALSCSKVFLAC